MLLSTTLLPVLLLAIRVLSAPIETPTSTIVDHSDTFAKRETPCIALGTCSGDIPPRAEKSPVPEASEIAEKITVEKDLALFFTGGAGEKADDYKKTFHPNLKRIRDSTPKDYIKKKKWDDYDLFLHRWSAAFAMASSGTVHVVIPPGGAKEDSHWLVDEWPILNGKNDKVDEVIQVNSEDFKDTKTIYKKKS